MTLTLAKAKKGNSLQITGIDAGKKLNKRMYEIGLNRGSSVKVIKNDVGPIIVNFENTKIALGRGLCEKILVQELNY